MKRRAPPWPVRETAWSEIGFRKVSAAPEVFVLVNRLTGKDLEIFGTHERSALLQRLGSDDPAFRERVLREVRRPRTLAGAKKALAALGMILRKRDGEYRVNHRDGKEGTAYYCDDLGDAYHTGVDMARRGR